VGRSNGIFPETIRTEYTRYEPFRFRTEARIVEGCERGDSEVCLTDPAAQWTGAMRGPAFFGYAKQLLD
jgi:hypothetical protein